MRKMSETTIQVHIPTDYLQFGIGANDLQHRISEWLVISLFIEGYISSGKAAHLLNIERADFLDLLRSRGIAYINYTPQETDDEIQASNSLAAALSR